MNKSLLSFNFIINVTLFCLNFQFGRRFLCKGNLHICVRYSLMESAIKKKSMKFIRNTLMLVYCISYSLLLVSKFSTTTISCFICWNKTICRFLLCKRDYYSAFSFCCNCTSCCYYCEKCSAVSKM